MRLHSSVVLGLGVIAFAILLDTYLIPTWVITPENVSIIVLSPDFWPFIIAALLLIGGVLLLLQYFFVTRRVQPVDLEPARLRPSVRVFLVGALMVFYYLVMPWLGMVWASVVAYLLFVGIIGFPRRISAIIISIALPVLLYGFFNHVAGVPIPQAEFLVLP